MDFTTQDVWKFLGTMLKRIVVSIIEDLEEVAKEDKSYIGLANEWRKILNWADDLKGEYPCPDDPVDDLIPVYIIDFLEMNFEVDEVSTVPPLVQYGLAYEKYLLDGNSCRLHANKHEEDKQLHFCQLLKSEKYEEAQAMDLIHWPDYNNHNTIITSLI